MSSAYCTVPLTLMYRIRYLTASATLPGLAELWKTCPPDVREMIMIWQLSKMKFIHFWLSPKSWIPPRTDAMKPLDTKFAKTLLQLFTFMASVGVSLRACTDHCVGILDNSKSSFEYAILFWENLPLCAESLLRLVPNQPLLSHTVLWCMMWLITVQPPLSLAGSTGTIQHTVPPAHCAASPPLTPHSLPYLVHLNF